MAGEFYEGSDAKFLIDVKALGFDQEKDDYTVELVNNGISKVYNKSQIQGPDESGNYFLPVEKGDLKAGSLMAIITVKIPDNDFPKGYREEKAKPINLGPIKPIVR